MSFFEKRSGFSVVGVPVSSVFSRVLLPSVFNWRFWPLLRKFLNSGIPQVVSVVGPYSSQSGVFWDFFLKGMACRPYLPWIGLPVWEAGVSSRWWHAVPKMPRSAGGSILRSFFRREVVGWDHDTLLFLSRVEGPIHVPASVFFGNHEMNLDPSVFSRCIVWDDLLWDDSCDALLGISEDCGILPEASPAVWVSQRRLPLFWSGSPPVQWCRFRSPYHFRSSEGPSVSFPAGLSFGWWNLALPKKGLLGGTPRISIPFSVRLGGFLSLWLGVLWVAVDLFTRFLNKVLDL